MFFYHGFGCGVASTISGSEFTAAACALSIRGGSVTAKSAGVQLPSGISFESADSSIRGDFESRNGLPVWVTEGMAVIENLNVQSKFTADRIEARIYSEARAGEHEASAVITGSKFENIRIAGSKVMMETSDDLSVRYPNFSSMQNDFQNSFSRDRVLACLVGRDLDEQDASTGDLRTAYEAYQQQNALSSLKSFMICSFVTKVSGGGGIKTWGPIIAVPDFGNIYLGEMLIWPWMRCLNLFRVELSSGGNICGGTVGANGTWYP